MKKPSQKYRTNFSDSELIKEIANRKVWAWEALYDKYAEQLFGLAVKILSDPNLAEEVLQHIFYRIWEDTERFYRVEPKLIVWLMLFCRDFCIKKLRAVENSSILMREIQNLKQDREVAFENRDNAQLAESLRKAFAQLPAEQRQAIELVFFKGYKQSEISSHLNLPLSNIQEQMRQGMQSLREAMFGENYNKDARMNSAQNGDEVTNP